MDSSLSLKNLDVIMVKPSQHTLFDASIAKYNYMIAEIQAYEGGLEVKKDIGRLFCSLNQYCKTKFFEKGKEFVIAVTKYSEEYLKFYKHVLIQYGLDPSIPTDQLPSLQYDEERKALFKYFEK